MAETAHKTVLIVEDNPLNMKLAADLLTFNGFEVWQAADGNSALQLLQDRAPQLILLDIHLPGTDGYRLFQKMQENPALRATKIVALTASAMREEEQRIRALGFHDYIAKPINTKQFVEKVRALVG